MGFKKYKQINTILDEGNKRFAIVLTIKSKGAFSAEKKSESK